MKTKRSFALVAAAAAFATAGAGTAMAVDHVPSRADRPAQHATVHPVDADAAGVDDVDAPGTDDVLPDGPRVDVGIDGISRADV